MSEQIENIIEFKSLSLWTRMPALAFGILVLASNIMHFRFNLICLFMLLLGGFCVAVSALEDSWSFDLENEKATRRFGFWLLPFQKIFSFEDIRSINVYEYIRPITKARFSDIILVLKNNKELRLDYDKSSTIKENIEKAEALRSIFYQRNKDF